MGGDNMTYKELYESAIDKLEKSKITLGEFEKMIEPLNAEIATADTDTISRQAVIDLLKQMRKDGDMVPWEGKDVFARIRELPAEPHWIPVTERRPETTDAVLTTYIVNGDRSRRYVEESSYYGNDESWSSPWDEYRIAGMRIEVIAWMPMPAPWKGE